MTYPIISFRVDKCLNIFKQRKRVKLITNESAENNTTHMSAKVITYSNDGFLINLPDVETITLVIVNFERAAHPAMMDSYNVLNMIL
ncbi:MAG: hypothetical protein U9R08_03550 [Nanoarchaeota archaeon]|nr:hypothetical protein [Nanoarchaeota archaeon]